jgi:hypothetical protein
VLAKIYQAPFHPGLSLTMAEQAESQKQAVTNEDPNTEEYIAPFEACPESTTPWRYYVMFREEHTPEAHAKAIGERELALFAPHPRGPCSGTMTDEYRERVRRDPGVERVIQYDGGGEWF